MKFICPRCKKVFTRDMRLSSNKNNLTKRGYKSCCLDIYDTTEEQDEEEMYFDFFHGFTSH